MPKLKNNSGSSEPRTPVQKRGLQTRQKLLESGRVLFMENGFHAVLADDVAREAGLSTGTFYSYFKDKRHLFLSILEEQAENTLQRAASCFADLFEENQMSMAEMVEKTLWILIDAHRGFLPLHLEAQLMAVFDEDLEFYIQKSDRAVLEIFRYMLLRIKPDIDLQRLPAICQVLYHASEGIVHQAAALDEDHTECISIVAEATRLFSAYLEQSLSSQPD